MRHVDLQGAARSPITAAALSEVLTLRDAADPSAVSAYERRYGVLAEGSLDGWQNTEGTAAITMETFELIWTAARQHLDSSASDEATT